MERLAYTVSEVAEMLGIPSSTLYEKVREKKFPSLRIGRHIRITRSTIDKHLAYLEDQNLF